MTAKGRHHSCSGNTADLSSAGLKSGIETATHAVKRRYKKEHSVCLLLVDADNAFNRLNRKASLENIKTLCLLMYTYLHSSYNTPRPTMLYLENGDHDTAIRKCDTRGTMQQ